MAEFADTAALTAAVARGETRAAEAFCLQWTGHTMNCSRRLSKGDEQTALDTAQEVMLRVVRGLPKLRDEAAVAAWIQRTALTVTIDRVRKERRRSRHEQERATGEIDPGAGPPDHAETSDSLDWLTQELQSLDPRDRELVLGRFTSDATLHELGASVGLTGNAAHGRIRRQLDRLRGRARVHFRQDIKDT